jgi:regulator of replication initiation timing
MRGRIDELSRQLSNSNDELRELRTSFGQVTSYNEVLIQENEDLRDEIEHLKSTRKGRRRYRDHKTEGDDRQVKRSQMVAHSSNESGEEGEDDNEAARVR